MSPKYCSNKLKKQRNPKEMNKKENKSMDFSVNKMLSRRTTNKS